MSSESELRRRELLRETKRQYRDQESFFPAVHPRYQRIYHGLYPNGMKESFGTELHSSGQDTSGNGSSFTTRLLMSAIMFAGYIFLCQSPGLVKDVDGGQVVEMVQEEMQMDNILGISGIEDFVMNFIK